MKALSTIAATTSMKVTRETGAASFMAPSGAGGAVRLSGVRRGSSNR